LTDNPDGRSKRAHLYLSCRYWVPSIALLSQFKISAHL
jgi:hypothetical protein